MHTHMHTNHTCAGMPAYTHTCTHACTHTQMHTHTHTHTSILLKIITGVTRNYHPPTHSHVAVYLLIVVVMCSLTDVLQVVTILNIDKDP